MEIFRFFKRKKEREIDFRVVTARSGRFDEFANKLKKLSLIILIIGKRGSGKTALGFKLLEVLAGKRRAYFLGKAHLPGWIRLVESVEKISNNSIVLVDEAALFFSARQSMSKSNIFFGKLMAIARHKDLTLILITQNCMPPDTEIITEKGVRKLGDLEEGEKVFSYNFKTKKIELKAAGLFEPEDRPVITIETADGDIIKCSPNHKLLVKEGDKVVKKMAKDLTEKDELFKPLKFR